MAFVAMAKNVGFRYEPLDPDDHEAFRILTILPEEHGDTIRCTVRASSLSSSIDNGRGDCDMNPFRWTRRGPRSFARHEIITRRIFDDEERGTCVLHAKPQIQEV